MAATPTSATYPADCVGEWDAIDNAGRGTHDATCGGWTNIAAAASGHDMTYFSGTPEWTANGWQSHFNNIGGSSGGFRLSSPASQNFYAALGDSWTFEVTCVPDTNWFADYSGILGLQSAGYGLGLGQHVGSYIEFVIGSRAVTVPASEFSAGVPLHFAAVGTPTGVKLYVNGALRTEKTGAAALAGTFCIGACYSSNAGQPDVNRTFGGVIHAVRAYARELTAEDVRTARRIDRARYFGATLTNFMASSSAAIEAPLPKRPILGAVSVSGLGTGPRAVLSGDLDASGATETEGVTVTVEWGCDPDAPEHSVAATVAGVSWSATLTDLPDDGESVTWYRVTAIANGMFDVVSGSQAIVDDATYVWNGAAEGVWSDAAQWTPSQEPNFGWPSRAAASARFDAAARVTLTGLVTNRTLALNADVTLALPERLAAWHSPDGSRPAGFRWTESVATNRLSVAIPATVSRQRRFRHEGLDASGAPLPSGTSATVCGLDLILDPVGGFRATVR